MNTLTKSYWAFIVAAGITCGVAAIPGWEPTAIVLRRLIFYVLAAVLASGLKIRLPGVFGTLSMNYVVIIASLLNLGFRESLIVAVVSAISQCVLHAAVRPRWYQIAFNVTAVILAVGASSAFFNSHEIHKVDPSGCLALLAGSLAYFVMNTVTVSGIMSLTSEKSIFRVWHDSYLWTSPQYLVGGGIAWGLHLVDHYIGWPALIMAIPPLYLVYWSYSLYLGRIEQQQKHILEMAGLHLRTIETLALAIDAKDDTTAAHLRRVQIYASEIGRELSLPESEMKALEAAALLHDVGKLAVPEYIISKPGKLTPDEFEKMKVHPVVGAEILERVHFPYPVVPIVRSHHEKWDGTGYPDGLAGENIPIGARILSVVDCLDALASDRQYRTALPLNLAMEMVVKDSGKAFDPRVVAILERRYMDLERRAREETADCVKLSSNVKVTRGVAPATGLAELAPAYEPPPSADFSLAISEARREFQLLLELSNDLGSSLSLEDTLALLAVRLGKVIEHDAIAIYLIEGERLVPRLVKGESYRMFSSLQIPLGQGLSGWVAEHDLPIVNGNPAVEPGYLNDPRYVTPLRSAISVPLRAHDRVVGVLTLYHLKADAFSTDNRRVLLAISPKAGLAIENSLRFERAANAADTDELTGLHNARYLFQHLQAAATNGEGDESPFAVIVMDLDGFKKANDEYGHLEGNRILQSVASGLRSACRAGDVVARLGGDEFVVVMRGNGPNVPHSATDLERFTGRILSEVRSRAAIDVSAGISRFPDDGTDPEMLLEKADERMYETKRRKKFALVA